jgi:hypothetical protein
VRAGGTALTLRPMVEALETACRTTQAAIDKKQPDPVAG